MSGSGDPGSGWDGEDFWGGLGDGHAAVRLRLGPRGWALKVVKMVSFMLRVLHHNGKHSEKAEKSQFIELVFMAQPPKRMNPGCPVETDCGSVGRAAGSPAPRPRGEPPPQGRRAPPPVLGRWGKGRLTAPGCTHMHTRTHTDRSRSQVT